MRAAVHPRTFNASLPRAYWIVLCAAVRWLGFGFLMQSVGLL